MISFTSADVSIGVVKSGDIIELTQICSSCSYVNLTQVLYPNNTYALLGEFSMTKNGTNFNYTYSNTNTLGDYTYSTCGDLDGVVTCQSVNFKVTPSGIQQNSVFENTEFIILLVLAIIFLALGVGFKLPTLGFIGSILLILLGIYTMIYGFNNVTNLYTQGSALTIIGLGIIFMFISAYEWLPWSGGGNE